MKVYLTRYSLVFVAMGLSFAAGVALSGVLKLGFDSMTGPQLRAGLGAVAGALIGGYLSQREPDHPTWLYLLSGAVCGVIGALIIEAFFLGRAT